jgi:hypothetical protein
LLVSFFFPVPGDWLEKLNGQNVTHRDLNDILSSINSREIVSLQNGLLILNDPAGSIFFSPILKKKKLQSIKLIFGRLLLLLLWLLLLEPNVDDLDAAGSFGWHSPTSVKSCHELFVRSVECKSNSPEGGNRFPPAFHSLL